MIVWLWDAGSARGVTDDEQRARHAAEASMHDLGGHTARVERASLMSGVRTMTSGYHRTGVGWAGQRHCNGRITWKPVSAPPESFVSR